MTGWTASETAAIRVGWTSAVPALSRIAASSVAPKAPLPAKQGERACLDELAAKLASSAFVGELERYRVGPAVGAHTGPFSFGAFWWPG